jgi:hypothetical protein
MLISSNNLVTKAADNTTAVASIDMKNMSMNAGFRVLNKHFPNGIEQNKSYMYVTRARWSMHDILKFLLSFTGKADVWITTWSITIKPATEIVQLIRQGLIQSLSCILDSRIRINAPDALQMLNANANHVHMGKIHAKTIVIKNKEWGISVTSSQNFTNVKRIEKGIIICTQECADFDINWINGEIHGNTALT